MWRSVALALCVAICAGNSYADFNGQVLRPCDNRPPDRARQPVTVPMSVLTIPGSQMFAKCHKQPNGLVIYGCTFQAAGSRPAIVLINGDQNDRERACTLAYEKAHLPPNNWFDPQMESATPDVPLHRVSKASSSSP